MFLSPVTCFYKYKEAGTMTNATLFQVDVPQLVTPAAFSDPTPETQGGIANSQTVWLPAYRPYTPVYTTILHDGTCLLCWRVTVPHSDNNFTALVFAVRLSATFHCILMDLSLSEQPKSRNFRNCPVQWCWYFAEHLHFVHCALSLSFVFEILINRLAKSNKTTTKVHWDLEK